MPGATSYNTAGNREDLTDIIAMVEPTKTPMYSSFPKGPKPTANLHEWQVDDYENVKITGVVDGSDVASYENKAKNRTVISNRVQEFRRTYGVTRRQEMVATAGVSSEYGRSKTKAVTEIKRDIESAIGSDNDVVVGTGSAADQMRALGKFIDSTNTDFPAFARTLAAAEGTTSSLAEDSFDDVIQAVYEACGSAMGYDLFANSTLQKEITKMSKWQSDVSSHTSVYRQNEDATSKTITRSVQFYNSDWGTVAIKPDLFLGRTDAGELTTASKQRGYLIEPGQVTLNFMQTPTAEEFDDMGGGRRGMVSALLTLCVKNPKGCGKFSG